MWPYFSKDSPLVVQAATLVLVLNCFADLTFVNNWDGHFVFDCHYLFVNLTLVSALTAGLSVFFQGNIYVSYHVYICLFWKHLIAKETFRLVQWGHLEGVFLMVPKTSFFLLGLKGTGPPLPPIIYIDRD